MALREVVHWKPTQTGNADDSDGFPDNYLVQNTPLRMREMQAALFRWFQDSTMGLLTTTGSGSAYAIATPKANLTNFSQGVPDGAVYRFKPHANCLVNPTLAVGGQAAAPLRWPDGSSPVAGALTTAMYVTVRFDSANSQWVILGPNKEEVTTLTTAAVNQLIEAAIQAGAGIWGRQRSWPSRIAYSSSAILSLSSGQWSQDTTDPTLLYVRADAVSVVEITGAAASAQVQINGTAYTLAESPSLVPSSQNTVKIKVASLGTIPAANTALTLRLRDEAIGKLDIAEQGTPTGTISLFAGSNVPSYWLECKGQLISRTEYANLYAKIGTTYGPGDGATTFALPDLRGRVPLGRGQGTGLTARTLGATGGSETHTLAVTELPAHAHAATVAIASSGAHSHAGSTNSAGAHTHGITGSVASGGNHRHGLSQGGTSGVFGAATGDGSGVNSSFAYTDYGGAHTHAIDADTDSGGAHTHTVTLDSGGAHTHTGTVTISNAGGGGAHNNMQPWLALIYMIKT